jgi:hypothetical protein
MVAIFRQLSSVHVLLRSSYESYRYDPSALSLYIPMSSGSIFQMAVFPSTISRHDVFAWGGNQKTRSKRADVRRPLGDWGYGRY